MPRSVLLGPLLVGLSGLLLGSGAARAQERGDDLVDIRNIGRAGTSTVSGDSGAAVVQNPAGMVRRSQSRLVVGLGVKAKNFDYTSPDPNAPRIIDGAAAASIPTLAYHHANQDGTWVLGVLLWGGRRESSLPTPAFGQPAEDVETLFPHRYGGTKYQEIWRQLAAGFAMRLGESIGLGASVGVRDIKVRDQRRIWAGFAGRDPLLGADRDLDLRFIGQDRFAPSASVGLLYAPLELPLEFAASAEVRQGARFSHSTAQLRSTNSSEFPSVSESGAQAQLERGGSATVRGGLRYLGERFIAEVGIDMVLLRGGSSEEWKVSGLDVVDESTVVGSLTKVRALHSERSHMTARGAIDYEALSGFLWVTGGYGWHSPATGQNARMPSYAQLGGHRLAVGLLAAHEKYTLNIGYSRRLARTRDVRFEQGSDSVVNPFNAGSGSANAGRYRSSSDQLGFALEIGW